MSDLSELINAIVDIDKNDEICVPRSEFYSNSVITSIIEKYQLENEKLFIFAKELAKFENKNIRKKIKIINQNLSDLFFSYMVVVKNENVKNFSDFFINCYIFEPTITIDELEMYLDFISKMKSGFFYCMPLYSKDNMTYISKEYGKELFDNGFTEGEFSAHHAYILNSKGNKLIKYINLDITKKEKRVYSKIINIKKMNRWQQVSRHRAYYEEIQKKISENIDYIKMIRLHEGTFKDFIEEYDVLIKYAIAKYGEGCKIRFCGNETWIRPKHDGEIKHENQVERVEITYPGYDSEEKKEMKQLNNFGHSNVKCGSYDEYKDEIKKKIEEKINNKNIKTDSYDNTITLVVMMDMHEFFMNEEINNKEFYDDLFSTMKTDSYIFKNVDILIDKFNDNSEPWIYKMK